MQSTRGAAILAAVAVLTGSLAACGDNSEPQESTTTASPIDRSTNSPSSSESSSSSGSEASSPSGEGKVAELPEEAKAKTKQGAIAFNEWYQVQMGEALKTGDSSTLRAYSRGCALCDGLASRVDGYTEKGTRMNVNPNSVTKSSARERDDSGYRVEVDVHASSYHEVLKDGSMGRTADAVDMTLVSNTQWVGKQWQIQELAVVKTK